MHFIVSFIGLVESLIAESVLVDNPSCASGGFDHNVDDMKTKKCPQIVRVLRLLVETVIPNTVQEANDDDGMI